MAELSENVKRLLESNVPEEEIANYIKTYRPTTIESPEGRARRSLEQPTREMSTITNAPIPTAEEAWNQNKQTLASGVRYGVPVAAGIMAPELTIPTLIAQAAIAGGSEALARRIERTSADPELSTLWSDIEAGGITGAVDFGLNVGLRGTGAAFRRIGKKLFIPSELPHEIQMAQQTLGAISGIRESSPTTRFLRWMQSKPATRPFSLTYGQINGEEKNFITWLEGVTRAGIGSKGVMTKFDIRNQNVAESFIEEYVTAQSTKRTGPEFAEFAKRIIGDVKEQGEMFLPVVAYRKFLYTQFEDVLSQSAGLIDGNTLRNYIREFGALEGELPRTIYSELRANGYVPPLEPTATTKRTVTNVRTQKVGQEQINEARDLERTDLKSGKVTQIEDTLTGTRARSNEGASQTIRETETIGGMSEREIADAWRNLPASDVNSIIKVINSKWKDGAQWDQHNNVLKFMGHKIEDDFMQFINTYQDVNGNRVLQQLHSTADEYFKKEVSFMRNAAIRGLRKTLTESPSKALSLLGGGESPARETYDRLIFLRDALNFSATSPRIGASLQRAVGENVGVPAMGDRAAIAEIMHEGERAGTYTPQAAKEEFEKTFTRPLRYRLLTRNVDHFGHLEPNRFLEMLNANKDVPEYFTEIFGGPKQVEEIKRLMTTLSVTQRQPKEKNIYIQLAQAGALTGGVSTALMSDNADIKTGALVGGVAIMISPYLLSRALTNAEAIRALTDGLTQGARSSRLAMSLRKMFEMHVVSELYRESPNSDAVNFYSTITPERQQ